MKLQAFFVADKRNIISVPILIATQGFYRETPRIIYY